MALSVGTRLGPYEVLEPIGAGGMGEVYRARDARLGRDVAIKALPAAFAADPDRLRRFELEARAAAALSHPNVLAVFDIGTCDSSPYIVSELLEGETLRGRIGAGGLTVGEAVELAIQIARGLAAAHEKGIVHRDLKPDNVFITRDGTVKILDFGLAKLTEPERASQASTATTATAAVVGTVGYMAPEQLRAQTVTAATDLFAFGCVLYEMLSGRRAFQGQTPADTISAILSKDPPPLSGAVDGLPQALDRIVSQCLEKRPEARFNSAHDLGLALKALSADALAGWRSAKLRSAPSRRILKPAVAWFRSMVAAAWHSLHTKPVLKLLVGIGVATAIATSALLAVRARRAAWARSVALPEVVRLVDGHEYWPAFLLGKRIAAVAPDDPGLREVWPRFAGEFTRQVLPVGAEVLARRSDGGERDWVELGETGGAPLAVPLGHSVFKVQRAGFEPREFAMTVTEFGWELNAGGVLALVRPGEAPEGMVLIQTLPTPTWFGLDLLFFDFLKEGHIASFFVDRHEVTNREYKRFLDAGGYQRREYWKAPFEEDGKALAWDKAMVLFRDATGRPGPAGWQLGSYGEGEDDYPVTGVSWYEAAAYAAFAGKRLPSVYHWAVASSPVVGGDFLPGSNFSGSLAPGESHRGSLSYWGMYDVAGNAREWCSNASGTDRFVLGGAADGPAYMFWRPVTKPPLSRDAVTGFRCIKPVMPDPQDAPLDLPVAAKTPIDWSKSKPFSEDAWRTWKGLLSYVKAPLDARVEWTDDSMPWWREEKVTFTAAYGNERVIAYLFLPKSVPPPWQAVVFWPGGYAPFVNTSQDGKNTLDASYWSYLVKDGRAVLYPILKGTFERGGHPERPVEELSWDHCIFEAKDIFRSIDYLETRSDIRKDRIGYLGFSWGAIAGPFVCAVEQRIKVQVLLGAGLYDSQLLGFVHRCSTPTEMINGRADGYAENQAPLFRALATPADSKRHVVFDADHSLSGYQTEIVKATLEWFDRYLGPVR